MSNDNPVMKPISTGEMEIYDGFKWPSEVPQDDWSSLTLEQKKLVMEAYRFGGYKLGIYQGITFRGPDGSTP